MPICFTILTVLPVGVLRLRSSGSVGLLAGDLGAEAERGRSQVSHT